MDVTPTLDPSTFVLEDIPRLVRLREESLDAPKAICVERARLVTEFFRREGFDEARPVLRQARALQHILENLTPVVFDDELVVGSTTTHRLGALIYPEFMSLAIWPELPTISRRPFDPVRLSDDDADLLANEVFPFWRDLTVHEYVRREGDDPKSLRLMERLVFYTLAKSNGLTHIIPDYPTLVRDGLLAIGQRAEAAAHEAPDEQAAEFHRAVHVTAGAVITLARRYSDVCEAEATCASTRRRAEELRQIAAILRRVPARPATTLHEALQSVWITQVALHQENSNLALSFGRLDQFLFPLYEADATAGRLDALGAAELVGCFFVKMGDHTPLIPAAGQDLVGGSSTDQAVTLGGMKPDGTDGVNDLTYVMLKVSELLALREPNVCARLHRGSPPRFRQAVVESIYRSGAAPALYGDEVIVDSLQAHGVRLEDARDYGLIGCVEPRSCGRSMGLTGAILFNLASVLELALNDGVHPRSGLQVGPATGRLVDFADYATLHQAFAGQLAHLVALSVDGDHRLAEAHAVLHPTPLLSALVQGTAEAGRDVTRGGARYSSPGVAVIGLADVADSLTALRDIVFGRRLVSPADLSAALRADFEGHARTHALLSRRAPKYGTDDPLADRTAAELVDRVGTTFAAHQNPWGGPYYVGYWSITMHAGLGALTGALPSGRRSGVPLASGATPVSGVARKGPTAALASTQKLPGRHMANGIANNHKIGRSLLVTYPRSPAQSWQDPAKEGRKPGRGEAIQASFV